MEYPRPLWVVRGVCLTVLIVRGRIRGWVEIEADFVIARP